MLPVATRSSQKIPLAHCESVALVNPHDVEQPHVRDTILKLQDVIAAVKTNLNDAKS
jgi:hypothetical protein